MQAVAITGDFLVTPSASDNVRAGHAYVPRLGKLVILLHA